MVKAPFIAGPRNHQPGGSGAYASSAGFFVGSDHHEPLRPVASRRAPRSSVFNPFGETGLMSIRLGHPSEERECFRKGFGKNVGWSW